jgi:hypothetical protein
VATSQLVFLQAAIAAIVQHSQGIDCAIERQFAPQPGEYFGAPFMGNAGVASKSSSQIGATG